MYPGDVIGDEFFVRHLEYRPRRQRLDPMLHQSPMHAVIIGEVGQVHGKAHGGREILEITRETGVDWVSAQVDDARLRKHRVQETEIVEIEVGLIDDAQRAGSMERENTQVLTSQ